LAAVIVAHAFCNWMGFPRFWGRVGVETLIGSDAGGEMRGDERWKAVGWTVVYYVLLVVGAVGWWKLLWPLTESSSALTTF
jgi:prenyl protein peptidase